MRRSTSGPEGLAPLARVFGRNVRSTRVRREFSVAELALRCHLSSECIEAIEEGIAGDAGLDEIVAIAEALAVEPADLIRRDAAT
jgi:transcriptional regulator with XRE-family HTH domain